MGETLSKVVRDKDPGAVTPRHIRGQDHLKDRVESSKLDKMGIQVYATATRHLPQRSEHVTYFPRVLWTDGEAEI